ncbi:TetR family transcriptional regulator [Aliiglaciecola sp. CAU 1673]|uniref:TetR family transcriptional regulator n=1 Tax=Aliiglaciecola sp. CAU 1673 TaxID=3032595 RepID=UPI0023D98C40|nr:TetR family transcriptional regulator [Aliiglaciecola sp. CAU 1673]MDF2177373.1 TetR family transcriptional regulator [Aliiglaciecola sp. CAU 1673]
MPRRTKEDAQKTRQSLLHTALMLFADKGVSNTTLTDIASAAGVTKGAFYWHFKNKLEVFEAINQEYTKDLTEQTLAIAAQAEDPVQGLLDAIGHYLGQVEQSQELRALLMIATFKCEYTDEFAPLMQMDLQELADGMDLFHEALSLVPESRWQQAKPDIALLGAQCISLILGNLHRWLLQPENKLREESLSGIRALLRGYGLGI